MYVRAYLRTWCSRLYFGLHALRKRTKKFRHYSKPAVYVAKILVYRVGEGQVTPLFEKKVHGIVDVHNHAFSYKELRTLFQFM